MPAAIQYILGGHWMAKVNEPVTSQPTKPIRKSIKLRESGMASAVTARNIPSNTSAPYGKPENHRRLTTGLTSMKSQASTMIPHPAVAKSFRVACSIAVSIY